MIALLLLAAAGACSRGPAPAADAAHDPDAPSRAREGALDMLVVATPVAPGSADWIPEFEQASGCKVRVHEFADSSQLLAAADGGGADLLLAGGDIAASLVAGGRVRALEPRRVPSLERLPPRLRELAGATVDGARYGVPVRWQPNLLAYDTRVHAQAPTSWGSVYAPDGEAAGAPALPAAEPMAIADAALYLGATRPELRITDPYALDERQYATVLALLRSRQPQWRGAARDAAAQVEALGNGVSVFAATPAQVLALQAQGQPVKWTAPVEGANAQVELAMLRPQPEHPNCANFWLEWSLQPRAQALLAARAGALPVRREACALAPLADVHACDRDGMALIDGAHFQRVPQARCGARRCVPYSRWTHDYLALLGE
jgi:putative spermidine/putrescine transport system substrate-binding protein